MNCSNFTSGMRISIESFSRFLQTLITAKIFCRHVQHHHIVAQASFCAWEVSASPKWKCTSTEHHQQLICVFPNASTAVRTITECISEGFQKLGSYGVSEWHCYIVDGLPLNQCFGCIIWLPVLLLPSRHLSLIAVELFLLAVCHVIACSRRLSPARARSFPVCIAQKHLQLIILSITHRT